MAKRKVQSGEIWLIENNDHTEAYTFVALIANDIDRGWYFIDLSNDRELRWGITYLYTEKDIKSDITPVFMGYKLVRRICGPLPSFDNSTEKVWR